jgi:hypothetical protein
MLILVRLELKITTTLGINYVVYMNWEEGLLVAPGGITDKLA